MPMFPIDELQSGGLALQIEPWPSAPVPVWEEALSAALFAGACVLPIAIAWWAARRSQHLTTAIGIATVGATLVDGAIYSVGVMVRPRDSWSRGIDGLGVMLVVFAIALMLVAAVWADAWLVERKQSRDQESPAIPPERARRPLPLSWIFALRRALSRYQ